MQQQLLIYISDLARALAVSEASIRSHLQRRHWPASIPPPLRLGRRWAWRKQDVEMWLAELAGKPIKIKKEGEVQRGRLLKAEEIARRGHHQERER